MNNDICLISNSIKSYIYIYIYIYDKDIYNICCIHIYIYII